MRWPGSFVAAALVVGIAGPSSAGQVQLAIHGGLVTLNAKDATLREIFAEWARVGQTRVVNGETVTGGPVTLQLTDVPERQALETLLRSAAGFIAAARSVPQPSLSTYDRIVLMPGARPAVVQTAGQPAQVNPYTMARDRIVSAPQVMVSDDEDQTDQGPNMPQPFAPPGMRPGMPGNPYTPASGQLGGVPAQQAPALPSSSQRPGVPTGPAPPIIKSPGQGPGGLR